MSGICGWTNNTLAPEAGADALQAMASCLHVNKIHAVDAACLPFCAAAAVGLPPQISVSHLEGLCAAVQGSLQWLDAELAKTAAGQGHARAALLAYRKHGTDFLRLTSGPFALCVADEAERRTVLAIDRLGIGSLFYAARDGRVIFSSSALALAQHPSAALAVDPQAIFDYLYFHMVPSPRCIFKDVEKLLPAQYVVFEDGKPAGKGFYWRPDYSQEFSPARLDNKEAEFMDVLSRSVDRARAGGKAGAFLSGGTDSSTVVGMFRKLAGTPVDTYSIGFDAQGYDETHYSRLAARHFDTRAHEYFLTPQDVVDTIPMIAAAYDEPFGNASAVAAYFCAKLAKADGLDTLLAGDGGDEIFAGNERYAKQKIFELYHRVPAWLRRHAIEPAIFNFPAGGRLLPVAKAQSYVRQANIPLPERMESYNYLHRMPLATIFNGDFLAGVDAAEPAALLRETYGRADSGSFLNHMLFLDWKFTLADNDLRKVSRMCELGQVEVRYPLLDEEMVRFSAELPVSLKLRGFQLRYFFKRAVKGFLPDEIIRKPKHGFGLPFGIWMGSYEPLREIAYQSLESLAGRGILDARFAGEIRRLHAEFPSYYGALVWVMMMLEQWLQSVSAAAKPGSRPPLA